MKILVEIFLDSVSLRAKAAFMIALGEKVIDLLKEDKNIFSLSRNLLDKCWLWEEALGAAPLEIYEYLDSSNEDIVEAQELSLTCQIDLKAPKPILTAIITIINTGSIVVKYAYEVMGNDQWPPVSITETSEDRNIPAVVEDIIENKVIDGIWIERAMSYLMSNYKSDDPNALGEPIKREELMSLA
jgi:Immunity protein Imm6